MQSGKWDEYQANWRSSTTRSRRGESGYNTIAVMEVSSEESNVIKRADFYWSLLKKKLVKSHEVFYVQECVYSQQHSPVKFICFDVVYGL